MSSDPDTQERSTFPQTRWTLIESLQTNGTDARAALAELCELYWHPVFSYLRKTGKGREDAEDETQGFFAHLLEKEALATADESRGKLRTFILTALRRYSISLYRSASCQKRGGGQVAAELDGTEVAPEDNPEIFFEKEWGLSLMNEAFTRTQREYQSNEKLAVFTALSPFLSGAARKYAELADELGMTAGAVQVAVYRLRKRYRRHFEQVVSETLEDPAELEEEICHILKIMAQ